MQESNVKWYKKWWSILIIIASVIFLALLLAFSLYIFSLAKKIAAEKNPTASEKKYNAENEDSFHLGANNPKITIVEFSDFACPFSKNSSPVIRDIVLKYNKDVKMIYRDFPVRQEYSMDLAMAARCAGEQGLFWPMHDKLFQNQGISEKNQIESLAEEIGVNPAEFNDCLENKKYLPQIQKDYADATDLKITGTPTWFINGYKVEGDMPKETWEKIIIELLK